MSNYRQAVIEAEAQIQEAGYTVGAFNRHEHAFTESNAHLDMAESGHLRYEKGRGIRKIQERDCLRCLLTGLNDGRWHKLPLEEGCDEK